MSLPAEGGRALGVLLRVVQQLPELFFLFLVKLVGLGAKELPLQIGNDRLGLGQLLGLLLEFLLRHRQLPLQPRGIRGQPGRIPGKCAQQFLGGLHPWRSSRKPRPKG